MFIYLLKIEIGMIKSPNIQQLELVAHVLKTISHPTRIGIINLLKEHGKLTVNEIMEKLTIDQSLISHHLSTMKMKGILTGHKQGRNMFYSIRVKEVLKVIECMESCDRRDFSIL